MSFKWDFEKGELVEGEAPKASSKTWSVVLVALVGFGVWFTLGGYKILFAALMGLLGL